METQRPRTSPHEFALSIYGVSATDGAGDTRSVEREDPHSRRVAGHDATVRSWPPEGTDWRAATPLVRAEGEMTVTVPDRTYFMDSPTELSDVRLRSWEAVSGPGSTEDRASLRDAWPGSKTGSP